MSLTVGTAIQAFLQGKALGIPWFATELPQNQGLPYGLIHGDIAAPADGNAAAHAVGGHARVLTEAQIDIAQAVYGTRKDKGCTLASGSVVVLDSRARSDDVDLPISGFGIPTGTTVASVTPGTGLHLSVPATFTGASDLSIGTPQRPASVFDPQLPELAAHHLATGKLQTATLAATPYRLWSCRLLMGPMELPRSQASNVKHHVIHVQVTRNLQTARV